MRAVVKEDANIGAVLKNIELPKPKEDEVLIKVKAAAICGTDIHVYNWNNWAQNNNINLPLILGHECSAEVVEVGTGVKTLKIGDYVACETHIPCGTCYQCRNGEQHICGNLKMFSIHTNGCFAEYATIPAICAVKIPETIHPNVGAVLEPLGTSIRANVEIQSSGKNIAVIGCGPIGLMAVNAAKAFGAANIYAADINDSRLEIAKELGATATINSSKDNLADKLMELTQGVGVDAFIDASGNTAAILEGFKGLRKGGKVALIGLPSKPLEIDLGSQVVFKEATIVGIHGRRMFETWTLMSNLLDKGLLNIEPVISHVLPLEEFEKGFDLSVKGIGGKVILVP
ncbi:MAG: L-threonine 3-dehydrogenase [Tissierellia bacterium]|jgi:threonine 3-dehydrogenase|nr:L-threonine 3-dehydrogenase [Tissierellia bacterium]HKM01039.1 L-threonine 3-dehydrogenase [Sedimentibacter sp.]